MANLKNWLPEMSAAERAWFDKCPKALLFEIARQFGMRVADEFTADAAFAVINANACLIASAPDLLAALRRIEEHLEKWADEPECGEFHEIACAAIAKAEGTP